MMGRKVVIPKNFFGEKDLPEDKEKIYAFLARVVGAVPTNKADKPSLMLLFDDGAEVAFYVAQHSRAKKAQAHIYLQNPNVLVEPHL